MLSSTSQLRGLLANSLRSNSFLFNSCSSRSFASIVPAVSKSTDSPKISPQPPINGQLRPQLNVPVDPNHGLYAFFRRKEVDGVTKYETIEALDFSAQTGRAWTAAELRRKSFKDLHTLWYVLLRERNLLATQGEETRRLQARAAQTTIPRKAFRVRKSMARIKYVINERRLAYEGALSIFAEQREATLAGKQEQQEALPGPTEPAETKNMPQGESGKAANLAAAGLFETVETKKESQP